MYKTDVMILTGAGASIPCDVPGMAGMARRFKDDSQGSQYADTYSLLRDLGASADVEDLLELSNSILTFTDEPVRDLVEVCVAPRGGKKTLRKFRGNLRDHETKVRAFRRRMFDWITDVCLQFDRATSEEIYSGIVDVAAENEVPIFTTNYDAVLDHVARELGISVVDNFFEDSRGRKFWDETLDSFHGSGLKLVKIHGSIQWHADPHETIEKLNYKALRNEEGEPLTRLLVFPTRFKDIYQRNYFPLYSAFTRTLGDASVLIVIGHSLRDEYLKAAIRERLGRGEFSLIFVGPDFPAREDLEAGVRGQRERQIVYLNRKVEHVYPLLYQTLKEIPPTEMRSHIRQASQELSRGTKDKIEIDDLPQWVREGERVQFKILWDTVVGGGELRAEVDPDKNRERSHTLTIRPLDGSEGRLVTNGRKKNTRPVELTVPKDGADSYRIRFILEDVRGQRSKIVSRVLRIRKSS